MSVSIQDVVAWLRYFSAVRELKSRKTARTLHLVEYPWCRLCGAPNDACLCVAGGKS